MVLEGDNQELGGILTDVNAALDARSDEVSRERIEFDKAEVQRAISIEDTLRALVRNEQLDATLHRLRLRNGVILHEGIIPNEIVPFTLSISVDGQLLFNPPGYGYKPPIVFHLREIDENNEFINGEGKKIPLKLRYVRVEDGEMVQVGNSNGLRGKYGPFFREGLGFVSDSDRQSPLQQCGPLADEIATYPGFSTMTGQSILERASKHLKMFVPKMPPPTPLATAPAPSSR